MRRLRILVLGGTGYIGAHYVSAAISRGHEITAFTRGALLAGLPTGVKHLTGDRNGSLALIASRNWDAVLDLATFVPRWVRTLGEALKGRVGHYTFVSTAAVYAAPADNAGGTDENSDLRKYREKIDPYSIVDRSGPYAELKVLCEEEAQRQFPGSTLILRPGAIVGPGDHTGAFTYWALRMRRGDEVLTAGERDSPVQMIDVRDMAEWSIRFVEQGTVGVFNAIGPAKLLTWGRMLDQLSQSADRSHFTWVPTEWLLEQGIKPRTPLLYWPTEIGVPGVMRMRNAKALAAGLTFRPLGTTVADTLSWYESQSTSIRAKVLLGENGQQSFDASLARERELLAAWHTRSHT